VAGAVENDRGVAGIRQARPEVPLLDGHSRLRDALVEASESLGMGAILIR
jgi:hypothetical protein